MTDNNQSALPSTMACWEHFEHEADIGVRGLDKSLHGAFEQAALAMTAAITDPDKIECDQSIRIECESSDIELLFADWLNAVIYQMSLQKMLFKCFEVAIDQGKLQAKVGGEKVDIEKHQPAVEIKGATYTELKVCQNEDDSWLAQCVVDL